MAVIGIDLGTTYSAAAVYDNGESEIINLEGVATLPSVVGLQKSGKIAVGNTAKRNQAKFPQDTIIEVKRKMGENVRVKLGDKSFLPQEISAMILSKIKELVEAELGQPVTGVVISCPAYFQDPARQATKEAGQLAGLNVLHIINEPTAAAYAYGVSYGNDEKEKLFLVYDLGGGTFDVTVIRMVAGSLKVMGTGGDPQLGGGNFDDRIVERWMLPKIFARYPGYEEALRGGEMSAAQQRSDALKLRLKYYAEEGKRRLCDSSEGRYDFKISNVDSFEGKPVVFNETLTMDEFDDLIRDLIEDKSLKWVDEALKIPREEYQYTEDNLTAILLVGGSTRVPLVRKLLQQRFPKTEIYGQEKGINPDEIVARGAAIAAADQDPEGDGPGETVLVDVTGHTLSVAVRDERENRLVLSPIVLKETTIPWKAVHEFQSLGDLQQEVRVEVYQGEGKYPEEATMIGCFFVQIAPIKEPTPLSVGLDLDANGILIAHATNGFTGQKVECRINYSDSAKIDPKELERRKAQLQAQLNAVINMSANPLDGGGPAAPPPPGQWGTGPQPGAPPYAPGGFPPLGAYVPPGAGQPLPTAPPAADPSQLMNPIMRALYQKAINSFARVPAERQGHLTQLVMEIENAARTGDQQRLMAYYAPLSQLLEGV